LASKHAIESSKVANERGRKWNLLEASKPFGVWLRYMTVLSLINFISHVDSIINGISNCSKICRNHFNFFLLKQKKVESLP